MEEQLWSWEGVPASDLSASWGVPHVHLFEHVGSTNDVARRLAAEGAPHGSVVLAEQQLAGRGRMGRTWNSPPGVGIWLSQVLRPADLRSPGVLPLLVGLAVAEAMDAFVSPAAVGLKWPNDLVVGERKVGGILCEGVWERSRVSYVVVGIGLNVLSEPDDFPEDLRQTATSVRIVAGRAPDRGRLAGKIVRSVLRETGDGLVLTPERLAALERRDVLRGREVAVTDPGTGTLLVAGTDLGISADGALLLRDRAGVLRSVHSGTVRPAA